jgi:hypothetical protein
MAKKMKTSQSAFVGASKKVKMSVDKGKVCDRVSYANVKLSREKPKKPLINKKTRFPRIERIYD